MNGVKNGITLAGRYAGEARDRVYGAVERATGPLLDTIAGMDFAGSYFGNPDIPEYRKFSAVRRNIIADESAILGIGGEYPTGKKPEVEIGIKEILLALGVATAAAGGMAVVKKYDLGTDDIDAAIAYLKGSADTTVQIDVPQKQLSAPVNASVKETPRLTPQEIAKQEDYGPFEEMKINTTANGTGQVTVYVQPGIKANVTKMMKVMEKRLPEYYDMIAPFLEGTTIVLSKEPYNYNAVESDMIGLGQVVLDGGGVAMMKGYN